MTTPEMKDLYLAQAFQHGRRDGCEGGETFETYAEALDYAKNWGIPFDGSTEHEMVIFEAVARVQGVIRPRVQELRPVIKPKK